MQTHRKKQAPLPPQSKQQEVENRKNVESISTLSTNITESSSAATLKTTTTSNTIIPSSPRSNNIETTESDHEKEYYNTNSIASSLTSSKNYYQYDVNDVIENNNNNNNDSFSISDTDDYQVSPVYTKEKSANRPKKKYFDEYSLNHSTNSKCSSSDDLSKAFAITIAVAEEYVAKDEALKAAAALCRQVEKSPSIDEVIIIKESNRVKSYNGAIIDKNTTLNSTDDFCDVDVKIDLLTNDQIDVINTTCDIVDEIDANRLVFNSNNGLINENNREIEVIYETFNHEASKPNKKVLERASPKVIQRKKTTTEGPQITLKEVMQRVSSKDSDDGLKKSVIYKHNLPSPISSADNSLQQQQRQLSLSSSIDDSSQQPQQEPISPPPVEHSSYKVIRPSDVYEKDGAYYSHDGTIRGYLGTVKKITTSKILSEIFIQNEDLQKSQQYSKPISASPPTPASPKIPTNNNNKTIEEKITKHYYNVIHTSNGNNDYRQFNNKTTSTVKSSLANIIASEKKTQKNNLASTSATSLQTKVTVPLPKQQQPASETTIKRVDEVNNKTNLNLNHLQNHDLHSSQYNHHQQKLSTSFVMSAKNKSNTLGKKDVDIKETLLNEIKSIVPLTEEHIIAEKPIFMSLPPPPPPAPPLPQQQISSFTFPPPPPPIAPKNFTLKTFNNKQQIVMANNNNNRNGLFEAIKNFNATTLRKASEEK
jgi:hypothetical protein